MLKIEGKVIKFQNRKSSHKKYSKKINRKSTLDEITIYLPEIYTSYDTQPILSSNRIRHRTFHFL